MRMIKKNLHVSFNVCVSYLWMNLQFILEPSKSELVFACNKRHFMLTPTLCTLLMYKFTIYSLEPCRGITC